MLEVQRGAVAHVDLVARLGLGEGDVVPDLALQAHVADQTLVGLGVQTRQVAGVRVAVRIAIGHVEQQHELVAARQRAGKGVTRHRRWSPGLRDGLHRRPWLW